MILVHFRATVPLARKGMSAAAASFSEAFRRHVSCNSGTVPDYRLSIHDHSIRSKPRRTTQAKALRASQLEQAETVQAASLREGTAESGDHVIVQYTCRLEDGTEVDSSKDRDPVEFVVGSGDLIRGFHDAVLGLESGSTRTHTVLPKDGFGEWSSEMLAEIPVEDVKSEIHVGDGVRLSNGLQAVVKDISNGKITIDANKPLAGQTLQLEVELLNLTKASEYEQATFGAGCFWGPELMFARIPGVLQTQAGYSQGDTAGATYEEVCSGLTGHNEVVQVTYDPSTVSYRQLLEAFVKGHNPTQVGGQGMDTGSQYRSGIYAHTEDQKQEADAYLREAQSKFQDPIATEVENIRNFTAAEDYHQQYLSKGGRFGNAQSSRKGCTDPIRCYG